MEHSFLAYLSSYLETMRQMNWVAHTELGSIVYLRLAAVNNLADCFFHHNFGIAYESCRNVEVLKAYLVEHSVAFVVEMVGYSDCTYLETMTLCYYERRKTGIQCGFVVKY